MILYTCYDMNTSIVFVYSGSTSNCAQDRFIKMCTVCICTVMQVFELPAKF